MCDRVRERNRESCSVSSSAKSVFHLVRVHVQRAHTTKMGKIMASLLSGDLSHITFSCRRVAPIYTVALFTMMSYTTVSECV